MVSLEQVKLLESKVTRTIDYVKKVTGENASLKEKLDSYQKRIDELETLIQRFREDQSRIEDGILSALDRLNQFEDALESKLSTESKPSGEGKAPPESKIPVKNKADGEEKPGQNSSKDDTPGREEKTASGEPKPLSEPDSNPTEKSSGPAKAADHDSGGELDIF